MVGTISKRLLGSTGQWKRLSYVQYVHDTRGLLGVDYLGYSRLQMVCSSTFLVNTLN